MQKQQGCGSQPADQQGLRGRVRMNNRSDTYEEPEVKEQAARQKGVINPLGAVPAYRLVTNAHRYRSHCTPGLGGVVARRLSSPAMKTAYNATANTSQIR